MTTASVQQSRKHTTTVRIARRLGGPVLLSAAIVSLVLAVPPLRGVEQQLAHVDVAWLVAAVGFELCSCLGFIVIFRLFFDEVPAGAARELAWAEQGSGALLPGGGLGALALGGVLLRRTGMSTKTIVERSSALFFLTSAINVAALVGGGALLATSGTARSNQLVLAGIPIIGGVAAAAGVLAIPMLLHRSPERNRPGWLTDLAAGIGQARQALLAPSWRQIGAVGWLGFDIAALGATFAAAGKPLPVAPLVLGYLLGYLANLIPAPGGFGVLEGGLAGALIAYGAPATQATAAVIIYHAIAFWVPSLGGVIGYARLQRRLNRSQRAHTRAPSHVAPLNPPRHHAGSAHSLKVFGENPSHLACNACRVTRESLDIGQGRRASVLAARTRRWGDPAGHAARAGPGPGDGADAALRRQPRH